MADRKKILRNVWKKLDSLPLGFGIQAYSEDITDAVVENTFGIDLDDTLREIRHKIDDIEPDSNDELQVEERSIYHALCRFRLSASIFFKFSTAVDGKTVDKTSIPKMLSAIIAEYDTKFKRWRSGSVSSIWTGTATLNMSTGSSSSNG